jgi:hypothetical protein
MANTPAKPDEYSPFPKPEWWLKEEATEAYFLEHAPGLKQHYAARDKAFHQIEDDALARHPDPTPEDIAAAEAAEAALPSRKRTEVQLRRDFEPLATHIPGVVKRKRKRFIQRAQQAWNKANPTPLTAELRSTLVAKLKKTLAKPTNS